MRLFHSILRKDSSREDESMTWRRLVAVTGLALAGATVSAGDAGAFLHQLNPQCSWYKQQAMNIGRQANQSTGAKEKQLRAQSNAWWKKYYDCLNNNDW